MKNVQSLAISVPSISRYAVMSSSSNAILNPALGAGEMIGSASREDFNTAMQKEDFHLSREMETSLVKALKDRGYKTEVVNVLPGNGEVWNPSDTASVSSDMLLFVNLISVLYGNGAFGGRYEPAIIAYAQLVNPKTGSVAFQQYYIFGNDVASGRDIVGIKSPKNRSFKTYEDVLNNPQEAYLGFLDAIPLLTANIVGKITQ